MDTEARERAKEYRDLALIWRERMAEEVGERRRMMLEIAGQYEKLAFQLERAAPMLRAATD